MPSEQEVAEYYQGFKFGMPSPDQIKIHTELIRSNVRRIVDDLHAVGLERSESLLDFGGGLGYFSNAFADHFKHVDMFDLDRVALDSAAELFPNRFGLRTTQPGIVPYFDRKYDVIFANQVIEHYTDLDLFFDTLRAAAHDNSIIVITTPNNRSFNMWVRPNILAHYAGVGARDLIERVRNIFSLAHDSWATCDPPRHVFAFNPENLSAIAKHHSLDLLKVTSKYCINDYYSPAKYGPVEIKDIQTLISGIANALIRIAIRTLARFDSSQFRGDDVVLIARPLK
jgi:2-polyprenyl-3-methyl-5-hydroxy-6-metoxy-1,4-benzoquinol methylase